MSILKEIKTSVIVTLVLLVVCCGIYPVVIFGAGQVLFPRQANGSLVLDGAGKPIASTLLGQTFSADKYFQSRPSAAGNGYDPTSSGGSNLGPTSSNLVTAITQRISDYRTKNNLATNALVPADAVTASGSGLDPHISVRNAEVQAPRVAKTRNLAVEKVTELIRANTDSASLGFLGDPGVNVLKLNLALDALAVK